MAREAAGTPPESVISIIGPGMKVVGDCDTEGTVRIEGHVEGSVKAGKAVVIGKQGRVDGDVVTQDAVISGHVTGTLVAESRLELQATCHIDGEVRTRRMQLEEGAVLNGTVEMGEKKKKPAPFQSQNQPRADADGPKDQGSESSGTPEGGKPTDQHGGQPTSAPSPARR